MNQQSLNATFQALGDPTRRAILARLANGDASVTELAEPFDMSLPAISRHLKVLENAELISRRKDAQWRRCRLRPETLKAASDWISQYREFWEGQFDALANYLEKVHLPEESKNVPSPNRKSKAGKGK